MQAIKDDHSVLLFLDKEEVGRMRLSLCLAMGDKSATTIASFAEKLYQDFLRLKLY